MEEQFPREEGYRITRYDTFKFSREESTDVCIKIVPCECDQYTIALEPVSAKVCIPIMWNDMPACTQLHALLCDIQIRASDIDFWKSGFDKLQLQHMTRMYPPRVKMTIMLRDLENHKLLIKFLGCSTDSQLDTELALPLGTYRYQNK